jgi:hypothetical protein
MIKMIIIGAYVCHKIHWKKTHKECKVNWNKFFAKV